jgi:hypothetical protein
MGEDLKILQVNSTIPPKVCLCSWNYRTVPSEIQLLGGLMLPGWVRQYLKTRSILSWWGSPQWRLSGKYKWISSRFMRAILGEGRVKGITENEKNKHTTLIDKGEKNKDSSPLNIWGTASVEPARNRRGFLVGWCSDEF